MFINNNNYDLNNPKEAKEYLQFLIIGKFDVFPFFTNLLLNLADIEDVHEERKEDSLAYTYFDHQFERIKIRINFNKIQNGMALNNGKVVRFNNENVLFIIYHELLHNFFHHFSRHEMYNKEYPQLSNIVQDGYCNEFLFRLFKEGKDIVPSNLECIDFDELKSLAKKHCPNEIFPFDKYEDKPLEEVVIEYFLRNKATWQKNNNGNGGSGLPSGTSPGNPNGDLEGEGASGAQDNHGVGDKYSKDSLKRVNENRKANNKSEISESEAANLASKKIDHAANEAQMISGEGMSKGEKEFVRFKEKIMKKDPFLNFVVIKNTIKKLTSKGYYKTYSKPSRKKQGSKDIVFKGRVKDEGLHVVVGVDVSGSVSDKELMKIYEMLSYFMTKNSKDVSMDIFYWSSCELKENIHFHKDIKSFNDLMKLKVHTSGGTDLSTVHNFLDSYYQNKKIAFLNITDGEFYYHKPSECIAQYFFCLTSERTETFIREKFPKATTKVCRIIP
ncbi:MAG: hypothetical protein ACRCXX_13690 [Cetobacterium sp.]|uniref:hypothetical protein n=1 Tax=Cetobacterium sp. TaxID=2071632 RepID=UPI003F3FEE15